MFGFIADKVPLLVLLSLVRDLSPGRRYWTVDGGEVPLEDDGLSSSRECLEEGYNRRWTVDGGEVPLEDDGLPSSRECLEGGYNRCWTVDGGEVPLEDDGLS